jgi:hypothetical protein
MAWLKSWRLRYWHFLCITCSHYDSAVLHQAIYFFRYLFNIVIVIQPWISLLQSSCGRYYCCNSCDVRQWHFLNTRHSLVPTPPWLLFSGTGYGYHPNGRCKGYTAFTRSSVPRLNVVCAQWSWYLPDICDVSWRAPSQYAVAFILFLLPLHTEHFCPSKY